ncbi:MAG TPA: outer membrane beta-barrel protein [Pyrinomonadaceae bacterium]|nr:outer membrane beta-barrel protein [Pyrinomonadaceae bacterium]
MKNSLTGDAGEFLMHLIVALTLMLFCLVPVGAQELTRPKAEIKGTFGGAGFLDADAHTVAGGSVRFYLTKRFSIEPELLYMRASQRDEDVVFTPNVALDVVDPSNKVVPYVIGGVGVLHHRSDFGFFRDSSTGWTASAGGGVKIYITDKLYIAPEARIGWEPLARATVSVGYTFSGRDRR